MAITYPSDFDKTDRKMAKDLVPDDVFVTDMIVLICWMDADGENRWKCYNATGDNSLTSKLGLLELGKHDMINRCTVVLPQHAEGEDGE